MKQFFKNLDIFLNFNPKHPSQARHLRGCCVEGGLKGKEGLGSSEKEKGTRGRLESGGQCAE